MLDPFTYGRLIGRKAAEPSPQDGVLREADEKEDCRGGAKCSISLSDDEVMVAGLDFVGFEGRQANVSKKSNMDRFRDFYGIGPAAASKVLNDIQQIEGKRTRVELQSFFLTLYYLKAYQTETVMSGWWKLNEKTIRAYVWKTLSLVHRLKEKKVLFGKFEKDPIFIISVDGVHCRTYEARKKPTADVYSHKSHGPAVSYELGIAVFENRLVWINGPFDASVHDVTIFRNVDDPENSLKHKIPEGKKAIVDKAYCGEKNNKAAPPSEYDSKELRTFKNRVRARHENFNARLKAFKILSTTFRITQNRKEKHKVVFESVCILCQYDLENGHPLWEV